MGSTIDCDELGRGGGSCLPSMTGTLCPLYYTHSLTHTHSLTLTHTYSSASCSLAVPSQLSYELVLIWWPLVDKGGHKEWIVVVGPATNTTQPLPSIFVCGLRRQLAPDAPG
jgi:hypothetical protein